MFVVASGHVPASCHLESIRLKSKQPRTRFPRFPRMPIYIHTSFNTHAVICFCAPAPDSVTASAGHSAPSNAILPECVFCTASEKT